MSDLLYDVPFPPRPADLEERTARLHAALESRILVLDGATGTALQAAQPHGRRLRRPRARRVQRVPLRHPAGRGREHQPRPISRAGCDIVETDSFGGTPLVLAEYGLADQAFELNRLAASAGPRRPAPSTTRRRSLRFVCGSMGPTTKAISVTGGITFEELIENFRVQALGLMAGGADYLLLETAQDTRNVKAGLLGIENAFAQAGWKVPVAVSATIETTGTMLAGQDAEALAVSLLHADLLYVGLNCATGPELMTDHVRTLSEICRTRVACVPNAGLPDEEGQVPRGTGRLRARVHALPRRRLAQPRGRLLRHHRVPHRRPGAAGRGEEAPRPCPTTAAPSSPAWRPSSSPRTSRPLLVGERTNVLGSRKFKQLIQKGEHEAAAEVGRAQVKRRRARSSTSASRTRTATRSATWRASSTG